MRHDSLTTLQQAVELEIQDPSLLERLAESWKFISKLLETFSQVTNLPIFVYLNTTQIFSSSFQTLPPFCQKMMQSENTKARCIADGCKRASLQETDGSDRTQLCHAGLLNKRNTFSIPPLGNFAILYGAKKTANSLSSNSFPILIEELQEANFADVSTLEHIFHKTPVSSITDTDEALLHSISEMIENLLKITVGFHWQAINMAHELSNVMLGLGLLAKSFNLNHPVVNIDLTTIARLATPTLNEARLGLYVVRNFLSHVSENRYRDANKFSFTSINLRQTVLELRELYSYFAEKKNLSIDLHGNFDVPKIRGIEPEIRRALHNVLSNAVKYSYHSTELSERAVRIWVKNPYDPGFRKKRFAITIENYGLGVDNEERKYVMLPGFRGKQAIAEVPIGSGIGLSEAKKIMEHHSGELRFKSRELHTDSQGIITYLTTVDLIFPSDRITAEK